MNSPHNQSCASTVLLFRSVFVASLLNGREDPDDQSRLYVCTVPGDMELSTTASLQHAVNEAMQADIAELREIYVDRIVPGRMPTQADYTWLAIFDGHPQVLAWG